MSKLLYIKASPRDERSKSIKVADALVAAYRQAHPDDEVVELDVFQADLPGMDGLAVQAKYEILHGGRPTPEQAEAWAAIEAVIEQFTSADKYVIAAPMWNFGIPYRLKLYIDLLLQPTYTFSYSPEEGYTGLVTGKPAAVVYARGGDYSLPETAAMDLQKPYLELVLGFIGFTDVRSVVVEPTLMGGPDVARQKVDDAIVKAEEIGAAL
jgi:FMN-dependent NADH-azoreductase